MSNNHLVTRTIIQSAQIKTSASVTGAGVFSLLTFQIIKDDNINATFSACPTADETRALIANLEQHLHNLKTCELELLAQQPQAQAA